MKTTNNLEKQQNPIKMTSTYTQFIEHYKKINDLAKAAALLNWDQKTYMPQNSIKGRSRTLSTLQTEIHQKITSQKMEKLLNELQKPSINDKLSEEQRACVREAKREFDRKHNIPNELIKQITKTQSEAENAWQKARKSNEPQKFIPYLEKLVKLKKQAAEHIGYKNELYDAALEEYEPGQTTKKIEKTFNSLKTKLKPIVNKIKEAEENESITKNKTFNVKKQKQLTKELSKELGYNLKQGRIDESAHPFTIGMEDDVRITNRYNPENLNSIYSQLHETGHALYEQGIPQKYYGTPIGQAISAGYHESQSRYIENQIGRTKEYTEHLLPKLKKHYPQLKDYTTEEYYKTVNQVKPTPIRVEADEVTYNLHIILRFDIELKLFRNQIQPKEIPQIWNQKMDEYLGITPETPAQGFLQDIHWSTGQFGYFPTYTLGNLYAAQINNTIKQQIPQYKQKIKKGNFKPITKWLKNNIHKKGRKNLAPKTTKQITGEKLNEKHLINHLKQKYYPIYNIK